MNRLLTNPYAYALLIPLVLFVALVHLRTDPDTISLVGRIYVFCILGYIGARYVGRAPILMWERDTSPEARNIVGWGISLLGFAVQIAYGWIYIAYDRPLWLASQYWSSSILVLVAVGLTIVATSVPRFPPFGDGRNGLGEIASLLVVIASALGVLFVSHAPQVLGFLKTLFTGLFGRLAL